MPLNDWQPTMYGWFPASSKLGTTWVGLDVKTAIAHYGTFNNLYVSSARFIIGGAN